VWWQEGRPAEGSPRPLTPSDSGSRFADMALSPDGSEIWCIGASAIEDASTARAIVAVPFSGAGARDPAAVSYYPTGVVMTITAHEQEVISATTELIEKRADRHNVAASVILESGRVFSGVDLFHFSGGPCAEIVTIGCAMTETTISPVTIVAVRKGGKGVVSPCGRCRQFLWDYFPEIEVIIPEGSLLAKVSLAKLLPCP
jgi:cytidine deaminase